MRRGVRSKDRKPNPATTRATPSAPTTGLRGNDANRNTGRSGRQNAATQRNMRREERVTVQGPVMQQQPDGMAHGGGGLFREDGCPFPVGAANGGQLKRYGPWTSAPEGWERVREGWERVGRVQRSHAPLPPPPLFCGVGCSGALTFSSSPPPPLCVKDRRGFGKTSRQRPPPSPLPHSAAPCPSLRRSTPRWQTVPWQVASAETHTCSSVEFDRRRSGRIVP